MCAGARYIGIACGEDTASTLSARWPRSSASPALVFSPIPTIPRELFDEGHSHASSSAAGIVVWDERSRLRRQELHGFIARHSTLLVNATVSSWFCR